VFIGATSLGFGGARYDQPVLRAFDSRTGAELWSVRLSGAVESAPMSFVGKDGRQYVVVTVSGHPDTDVALIAFALPRPGDAPVALDPAPLPPLKLGAAEAPAPAAAVMRAQDLPAGPGRDDVAKVCTGCHAIATATAQPRTRAGWTATVEEMRSRGARMDDATAQRIEAYLAAHFGL
jgi:hypothetical protein